MPRHHEPTVELGYLKSRPYLAIGGGPARSSLNTGSGIRHAGHQFTVFIWLAGLPLWLMILYPSVFSGFPTVAAYLMLAGAFIVGAALPPLTHLRWRAGALEAFSASGGTLVAVPSARLGDEAELRARAAGLIGNIAMAVERINAAHTSRNRPAPAAEELNRAISATAAYITSERNGGGDAEFEEAVTAVGTLARKATIAERSAPHMHLGI